VKEENGKEVEEKRIRRRVRELLSHKIVCQLCLRAKGIP
jgi:hypothetical protein